jgi:hypothetical protein
MVAGVMMTAGVISYGVKGRQYVAAASGRGSCFPGGSHAAPTIVVSSLPVD